MEAVRDRDLHACACKIMILDQQGQSLRLDSSGAISKGRPFNEQVSLSMNWAPLPFACGHAIQVVRQGGYNSTNSHSSASSANSFNNNVKFHSKLMIG
jgi:hypothetical protein